MSVLVNEAISVIYHHGSRITLTSEWRDKNIICPNSKIYFVIDGELCVEIGEKVYLAKTGDAILIPSGTKHSYYLTELGRAEKYWFHFDLRLGQRNYFDTLKLPYIKSLGITDEIIKTFESIVNKSDTVASSSLEATSSILKIVSIYAEGGEFTERFYDNDETDEVIKYVKKNYAEKLTLEKLSNMARLTPNYFTKKFKEKTGHTPLKYVNILRLERAKFLLEHTDNPINDVMEEVGFLDAAHFSKLFKLGTGYTPTKYRKALNTKKHTTI